MAYEIIITSLLGILITVFFYKDEIFLEIRIKKIYNRINKIIQDMSGLTVEELLNQNIEGLTTKIDKIIENQSKQDSQIESIKTDIIIIKADIDNLKAKKNNGVNQRGITLFINWATLLKIITFGGGISGVLYGILEAIKNNLK